MSATFRSPKATVTTPKVSSGSGSRWVSPSISVTDPPAFGPWSTFRLPITSISWQKSDPTTGAWPFPTLW